MNTKTNSEIFLKQNNYLPTLYMYMVFAETLSPILFACRDDASNVYICSCHCQNAVKQEWIITQTSHNRLIDLLTDKLSIKEIFVKDKQPLYVVTVRPNDYAPEVVKKDISTLQDILPSAGYYMEADPGEFDEELKILQREADMSTGFNRISIRDSFNTLIHSFYVNISISDTTTSLYPANYLTSNQNISFVLPTR